MKTEILNNLEAVLEYLNDLDDNEKVNIHNDYCREKGNGDDEIYNNDEDFFTTYFDGKVMEAIRAISFGEYRYQDEFIKFNGYANLETFNDPSEHIDLTEIANDILEHPENYYNIELIEPEEEETEE